MTPSVLFLIQHFKPFQEIVDLVETLGIYVRVFAGVDVTTRKVSWTLQAIDPETGRLYDIVLSFD